MNVDLVVAALFDRSVFGAVKKIHRTYDEVLVHGVAPRMLMTVEPNANQAYRPASANATQVQLRLVVAIDEQPSPVAQCDHADVVMCVAT